MCLKLWRRDRWHSKVSIYVEERWASGTYQRKKVTRKD